MPSPITSHGGPPLPLGIPPNNQAESDSVEQSAASPKKTDEQALPHPKPKSGQENLQRFLSAHDKAGKTSGGSGTSADANVGADAVAESSGVRRRASRVQEQDSPSSAQMPSRRAQRQRRDTNGQRPIAGLFNSALKVVVSLMALSAGFRLVRNPRDFPRDLARIPGDFARGPAQTLIGLTYFHERVDEGVLQAGQQAVLERFGSYIPADARCHRVRAEVSPSLSIGTSGNYHPKRNALNIAAYQLPLGGLHTVAHEYCHCFTHPKFYEATDQTPNRRELLESLTEHITNKVNKPMIFSDYASEKLSNGKKMTQAAQELEDAVGEATLMRAYFGGDEEAIRKVSRAAVDIFPQKVALDTWNAIKRVEMSYKSQRLDLAETGLKMAKAEMNRAYSSDDAEAKNEAEVSLEEATAAYKRAEKSNFKRQLAECFIGASLLGEGKLPLHMDSKAIDHLPISRFSQLDAEQQEEIKRQSEQARERLGAKFDQAFYNFDKEAAVEAMKEVYEDLQANWKCVLPERTFFF